MAAEETAVAVAAVVAAEVATKATPLLYGICQVDPYFPEPTQADLCVDARHVVATGPESCQAKTVHHFPGIGVSDGRTFGMKAEVFR